MVGIEESCPEKGKEREMMVLAMFLGQVGESMRSQPQTLFWLLLIQWLLPLTIGAAFYGLLALCIYRAAKYFGSAGKEQKLLRMEMGKLAEEVQLLRQEFKGGKERDSSKQSG